jgi:hypothetical protein
MVSSSWQPGCSVGLDDTQTDDEDDEEDEDEDEDEQQEAPTQETRGDVRASFTCLQRLGRAVATLWDSQQADVAGYVRAKREAKHLLALLELGFVAFPEAPGQLAKVEQQIRLLKAALDPLERYFFTASIGLATLGRSSARYTANVLDGIRASLEPATSAALSADFRDDWNAMLSPSHARCGERRWIRAMEHLLVTEAERLDDEGGITTGD